MYNNKLNTPIKGKLLSILVMGIAPLLIIIAYLIISLLNYSNAYESIVSNLTIVNDYNVSFKNDINEGIYKEIVGHADLKSQDEEYKTPEEMINEFQTNVADLMVNSNESSRVWLQRLSNNLNSLKEKVLIIENNLNKNGFYDNNMEALNSDIYIITDLIQDDVQYYIQYQTKEIETLTQKLHQKVIFFIVFWSLIVLVVVIIAICISVKTVRKITKPLNELIDVTNKISEGDFESKVKINSDDEMMLLADSVNDMSDKLNLMVETIKQDEKIMRYTELRLLQEQINPHFLYNTLDTIVWLVESNDNEKAIEVVMALSQLFRLVLSKGQEIIPIKNEKEHIETYLSIQQVRYNDILDFSIDIDKDIYNYEIQKLTLQPLVENSLYHGIKYKRAKGKIEVTGRKEEDNIILSIKDDGVGMDEDTLNRLRTEIKRKCKETDAGFGLANVNERIRMHFGEEYGMTIDSKLNKGTVVTVIIPAINYTANGETKGEETK